LLTSLVEKSLVVADAQQNQTRYRLLETVRQYAREKLADQPGNEALRGRHRDYYLALAEEAKEKLLGAQQQEWLERLEREHDNLRAALDWCEQDETSGQAGLRLAA